VRISGTSASAPTFAGIVTLLNDALIAAGKHPLGFLNPMLYSIGVDGLNDITSGNAPGCGTPGFNVRQPPSLIRDFYLATDVLLGWVGDDGLGPRDRPGDA
jgi:subtilase family serine protease